MIENIDNQIKFLQERLHRDYGRIPPFEQENIKKNISNLKIQKAKITIGNLSRKASNDPIARIEIEKQNLMIRFYELEIQQSNLRVQQFSRL